RPRAQSATPPGRDVPRRGRGARTRFTRPGAFLVDRPGGDLLGACLGGTALSLALLDVLVLTGALGALLHASRGHLLPPRSVSRFDVQSPLRARNKRLALAGLPIVALVPSVGVGARDVELVGR